MIVRPKELYEGTAKKHNLPIDLVESVGICVFDELRSKLDGVNDLAYELPKLGTFSLRFNLFERYYLNFLNLLNKEDPEMIKKRDANPELFSKNTKVYKKIQEFREAKRKKRKLRYEDKTKQSSENNLEEHKEIPSGMEEIHPVQDKQIKVSK